MDCRLLHSTTSQLQPQFNFWSWPTKFVGTSWRPSRADRRSAVAAASSSQCEFGGLNLPLMPRTPVGRFLSGVLLDDREYFTTAVQKQLEQLAADRSEAWNRMCLSIGSGESCLHRRIADMKEEECQNAVEDVLYMLILYKFSEIRVHLVPKLSQCTYNGRLEIWPSKDWELESIHNFEVLEMVREHISVVVGWKAMAGVRDSWTTTKIKRFQLCQMYAASLLYGYFLKSVSLRYHFERCFDQIKYYDGVNFITNLTYPGFWTLSDDQSEDTCSVERKWEKLKSYVRELEPEVLKMCAKPKSTAAVNLIRRHSYALFGDEKTGLLETNEVISTSLGSLKRFVLEATAFGSFLWDSEEFVNSVFMLEDNLN